MKKLVCRFLCLGIVLAVSMNLVGCSDDDGPVGTLYFLVMFVWSISLGERLR